MKRNLLVLAVMIAAVLFFTPHNAGAQCPEDPSDLGICDSIIVEIFDCDHEYDADPGSFDSVRVAIWIVHDSNTFWWESESKWVQDSIGAFVIPLKFWHEPEGTADSVLLPPYDWYNYACWNNTECNPASPEMNRSIWRDLVDEHTGDTAYNWMYALAKEDLSLKWVGNIVDIEPRSCEGDSGHVWISTLKWARPTSRAFWETPYDSVTDTYGRTLLATLTFHVYMSEDADTTEIGIDSMFWPPASHLTFTRIDGVWYYPRHYLPVKDTIYIPYVCGDCNGDGITDIADVIGKINYLFLGASLPCPPAVVDHNGDGVVDVADVVAEKNYLFFGAQLECPLL